MEIRKFFDSQPLYTELEKLLEKKEFPPSFVIAQVNVKLKMGEISITKNIGNKIEGISMVCNNLDVELRISDTATNLDCKIIRLSVTQFIKEKNSNFKNEIKLLASDRNEGRPLLSLLLEVRKEGRLKVFAEMGVIEFKIFPLIMKRVISYFIFTSYDKNLKQKAQRNVKKLQNLTKVIVLKSKDY